MIGVDLDANGDFYFGRNSCGANWDESGNFSIGRTPSNQTCYIESWGILPKVGQTDLPVPYLLLLLA